MIDSLGTRAARAGSRVARLVCAFFVFALCSFLDPLARAQEPAATPEATPPPATASATETKDLDRRADRIVIFGEDVPALVGSSAGQLVVLAFRDGALSPIPFQMDERNPFGFLVLDQGPFAEADSDGGRYDENDELVFLVSDAGDKAPPTAWAAFPDVDLHAEVQLADPVDHHKAWAYVARMKHGEAPRSPTSYVSFDPKADRISTSVFAMGFPDDGEGNRRAYPNYLSISTDAGGSGKNLLDRLKLRTDAQILWGLLGFSRSEDEFRSKLLAWRVGPVRAIRRVETAMHLMFGIYAPPIAVDNIYYRDFLEAPNLMDVPINLGSVLSKLEIRVGLDLSHEAHGMHVLTQDNHDVPPLDGVMSDAEKNLVTKGQTWQLATGPGGTLMSRVIMGPTLPLEQRLYYLDDDSTTDGPEFVPGVHEIGRDLLGGLNIKKGKHTFNAFLYAISNYHSGDEQRYLAQLDRPLKVDVSGPATVARRAGPGDESGDGAWRELLASIEAKASAIDAYTATLHVYSSTYRGRKLEGSRTYAGKFHRDPRWVYWSIDKVESNYDDPIAAGIQTAYFGDEDRVVARGNGVRKVFGTVEMKAADAASWWWGETVTNQDFWSMVEGWKAFTSPGYGEVSEVELNGEKHPVLTLVTTRKDKVDLKSPLGTGASNVRIKKIRIVIDPTTGLPERIDSFIPGNASPVAWIEISDLDTKVELTKDDFQLSFF
ncbi:MAG: hypothetical protein U0610_25175 [bacterium]